MPKYDEKGFKLNESAIDYKSDSRFTQVGIDYAKDPRYTAPVEVASATMENETSAIDYTNDPRFKGPEGMNYDADPRFTAPEQQVSAIDYKNDPRFTNPAIDYAKDPRFTNKTQVASATMENETELSREDWLAGKDLPDQIPTQVKDAVLKNRKDSWLRGEDLPEQMPASDKDKVLGVRRAQEEKQKAPIVEEKENTVKPYSPEWLEGKDLPDQMPTNDRDTVLKNRKESWLKGEDLPDQMPSSDKDEVLGVRRAQEDAKNRPEQAEEKTETDKWFEGEDLPEQMPSSDKEKVIAERQKQHDAWLEGKDLPDQMPTSDKEKVIAERQKQEEAKNRTDDTEVLSETMEDEQERISDLADKTIRGEYGNGQERKDALGDDYEKVQKEVNERMEKVKDEGLTAENGKEFDAAYYAENNPDVVQVYGNDPKSLLNHYNEYGQYEGRKASNMDAPQQTSGVMNYLGELSAQEGDMDFELKDGSILSVENNNGKAEFFLDGNSLGSNADAVERKLISQGHMNDVSKNGLDELIKQNTVPNNAQQTNENMYQVYMSIMNGEKTV